MEAAWQGTVWAKPLSERGEERRLGDLRFNPSPAPGLVSDSSAFEEIFNRPPGIIKTLKGFPHFESVARGKGSIVVG